MNTNHDSNCNCLFCCEMEIDKWLNDTFPNPEIKQVLTCPAKFSENILQHPIKPLSICITGKNLNLNNGPSNEEIEAMPLQTITDRKTRFDRSKRKLIHVTIPLKKSDSLSGMCILNIGLLLEKYIYSFKKFVELHGGITTQLYSKKVTHVITGICPRHRTIQQADFNRTTKLNERTFLDLVQKKLPETQQNGNIPFCFDSNHRKIVNLNQIIDQGANIKALSDWLLTWDKKNLTLPRDRYAKKSVLLSGRSGLGKTTVAQLIAKKLKYKVFELDSLHFGDGIYSKERLKCFIDSQRFVKRKINTWKSLVIIDNLDCLNRKNDVLLLIEMIKQTEIPFICICIDRTQDYLKLLDKYCLQLNFNISSSNNIACFIKEKYNLFNLPTEQIVDKVDANNCDINYILNNLNFLQLTTLGNNLLDFPNKTKKLSLWQFTSAFFMPQKLSCNNLLTDVEKGICCNNLNFDLKLLFLHENYCRGLSLLGNRKNIKRVAQYLNRLCEVDLINNKFVDKESECCEDYLLILLRNGIRWENDVSVRFPKWKQVEKRRRRYSRNFQNDFQGWEYFRLKKPKQ